MVLIGLILNYFYENLTSTTPTPNHVIHISKADIVNIRGIVVNFHVKGIDLTSKSSIDLSKLEYLRKIYFILISFYQ